jgi:hypothetical protein
MEHKKFEQLIDLIINEQEDKAQELFHEIVVEKSREIYESIMDEEVVSETEAVEEAMHDDMTEEGMVGEVGDLMDEVEAEQQGMAEAEDEEVFDLDADDEEGGEEELEDRVDSIEDKLEQLMAEFEEIMGGGEEVEMDAEMGSNDGEEVEMDSEEVVAEAVQLQKVSVTHGDDGANKKSVVAANSGAKGMDSKPVKFSGDHEAVPTSPKGPSNEYSKKEGDLPGAGSFKNVPGGKAKVDLSAAPKPVTKDGSANSKSPVAKG